MILPIVAIVAAARWDNDSLGSDMLSRVKAAGWIVAFAALCAVWTYEVVLASRNQQGNLQASTAPWICPIAGRCGPPGTPGLGRW